MNLMRSLAIAMAVAIVLLLAGCDHGTNFTYVHISTGHIELRDGKVILRAADGPDATVARDGTLRIGARQVTVDAGQQQLLRRYYRHAQGIAHQGVAIGKASASMAGHTVADVLDNVFSGHPDRIEGDVKKHTDGLLAKVGAICGNLQSLQTDQDAIAASLPAFRPYARLKASDVQDCREGIAKGRRELATSGH